MMRAILLSLGLAAIVHAQITIACSPEPPEVVASLHMRSTLPWACFIRNDGAGPRTLNAEDVYIGIIGIRPLDPGSALIVLNDKQGHSTAATIIRVATIAGQVAGVVTGFTRTLSPGWSTGLAVGSGAIPTVMQIAQGQVPSTTPFTSALLRDPIVLPQGGAATRMVFCAKQKAPQPITVKLP